LYKKGPIRIGKTVWTLSYSQVYCQLYRNFRRAFLLLFSRSTFTKGRGKRIRNWLW